MEIKIMGIIILVLLLLPLVNAEIISYHFEQESDINLKLSCANETNGLCSSVVKWNITILYPNHSLLVDNKEMTWNTIYYNYSMNSNYSKKLGVYTVIANCYDTCTGNSRFLYEITPSGTKDIGSGQGLNLLGSNIAIIVIALFLFGISFVFKSNILKIIFIGTAGLIFIVAVLYNLVILTQSIGGFSVLVEGYGTFWVVIRSLITIALLALLIFGLWIAIRIWNFKRGFID